MGVNYYWNPDKMTARADAAATFGHDELLTTAALLPYRSSGYSYRSWDRISVAPVPGTRRQPKIWKRVGGMLVDPTQEAYQRSMAELESQGEGPRKRARYLRWVPAWGDMKWDSTQRAQGVEYTPPDVLASARAAILAHENEMAATTCGDDNDATPTYPANALKYVPRKRHNTRWPIEPKKATTETAMIGELQPLIEYEIPASPEHVETRVDMDEQQMMKRSTRRLSKRFSIIPGQDSPRKLPMVKLTPAENAPTAYSPVKRPPVSLSPTKVADSPHRNFKINVTPTKVILETPKISPPSQSPLKSSAPSTPATEDSMYSLFGTPPPESPGGPLPLTFDQPVLHLPITPEHETRRRIALQSARRRSRDSSGLLRILALKKSASEGANRRHSLPSLEELSAEVHETSSSSKKGRRKTMDPFCVDEDGVDASASTDECAATTAKEVLEIDMKTSPDIFGQPIKSPELPKSISSNQLEEAVSSAASGTECPSTPTPASTVSSPAAYVPETTPDTVNMLGNSISTGGTTPEEEEGPDGAENAIPGQAAIPPSANQTSIVHDTSVTISHIAEDPFKFFGSEPESEGMFEPQEPEGLSTIYEESTMLESSPLKGVAPNARLTSALDVGALTTTPPTPDNKNTPIFNQAPTTPDAGMLDPASTAADISPDQQLQNELMDAATNGSDKLATSPQASLPNGDATSSDSSKDVSTTPVSGSPTDGEPSSLGLGRPLLPSPVLAPDFDSPFSAALRDMMQQADPKAATATTQPESSGFTPINGRTFTSEFECKLQEQDETEVDHDMDDLDADEVIEQEEAEVVEGEEATAALDATDAIDAFDETATVQPPRPENDTLQLFGRQHDPEAEMLRDFVTRVTADKNAKAAAAAAALAKKIARRSSSLGSTTSATGSPMAKLGSPTSRTPLGVKSPNSPSLSKKRKAEDSLAKDETSQVSADESSDEHRLKRRKRADPVLESPVETSAENPSPDRASRSPGRGPRRSTRARRALRPAAPSANSIALSMIPVRLPGMGAMDEAAMDAHMVAMTRQREEKDLVSITRVNTRKNKGTAVPPQAVLAKQAEDPAAWRMRELKGVFEAKDKRGKASAGSAETGNDAQEQKGDNDSGAESKTAAKQHRKGVRWAEELVRFQTEEPGVFHGMARSLLADVMSEGDDDDFDEIAEAEPPRPATPIVEKTARVAARKNTPAAAQKAAAPSAATETAATSTATAETTAAAPLANVPSSRTRSKRASRLPPPTPVKKLRNTDSSTATAEVTVPAKRSTTSATKKTATTKKSTSTTSSAGIKKPSGVKKPSSTATSSTSSSSSTSTTSSATGLRARARPLSKRAAAAADAALAEAEEASSAALKSTTTTTSKAAGARSAATGMATRRTRVTKLGMSANGTPAPKRRGRAAGSGAA